MIGWGGLGSVPYLCRFPAGLRLALGVLGFALALYGLHARPVLSNFLRGELAADVRSPGFVHAAAKATEPSGGQAICMEDVPASVVARSPLLAKR